MLKKKFLIGTFLTMIIIGGVFLFSCSSVNDTTARAFLNKKYPDINFYYKGEGSNAWSSGYNDYLFEDNDNRECIVRFNKNVISGDNYQSSIYDKEMEQELEKTFGKEYVVRVSTKYTFLDEQTIYNTPEEYFPNAVNFGIQIFTNQPYNFNNIKTQLFNKFYSTRCSINVIQVSDTYFTSLKNNKEGATGYNEIKRNHFLIEDKQIKEEK